MPHCVRKECLVSQIAFAALFAGAFAYAYLRIFFARMEPGAVILGMILAAGLAFEHVPIVVAALLSGAAAAWTFSDAVSGEIRNNLTFPVIFAFIAFDIAMQPVNLLGLIAAIGTIPFFFWPVRGGFGGGDIKAIAIIGLALGLLPTLVTIMASCVVALGVYLFMRLRGQWQVGDSFRFGPYLAVGVVLATPLTYFLPGMQN